MPDKLFNAGRLQEIKAGEFAPEVYTVSARAAAVAQQRMFYGGTGRVTLGAAGHVRALIANPAGSGRNVFLDRIDALATALVWGELRAIPTTGLPAGARGINNMVIGSSVAAVATMKADTDALTPIGGGALHSAALPLPANARTTLDLPPIVLPPGTSLCLNFPFVGAGGDASLTVYFFEEDL